MICPNCRKAFTPKGKEKYCSSKCKWTYNNRNRTLKPNQIFDCVVCGKHVERYVSPSDTRYTNRYCERECKGVDQRGENHPLWKGGRVLEADGYVMLRAHEHPNANNKGYVFEHRLVMEAHLGRYLDRKEVVHHRNGNRSDNRIENLELFANNAIHKRHEMHSVVRDAQGRITSYAG